MPQHARDPVLRKRTDEVGMSARTALCLTTANILYVGDLVQMTESELLRTPHIGVATLHDIKVILAGLGLHLGMQVDGWPPEDIGR